MPFLAAQPSMNDAIQTLNANVNALTNAASGAGSVTLTTTQFINGIYVQADGGTVANKTTPTAAAIVAAIRGCQVGTTFDFVLQNDDAADAMTVVAGTGVTLKGTATVAGTKNRLFRCVVTSITAASEAVTVFCLAQLA